MRAVISKSRTSSALHIKFPDISDKLEVLSLFFPFFVFSLLLLVIRNSTSMLSGAEINGWITQFEYSDLLDFFKTALNGFACRSKALF